MSLVVGRTTPRGIRMTGDMRVTDPNATRSGYLEATLKTVLISPTLCVGYAGSVGTANEAIRVVARNDLDVDAAVAHLERVHQRSGAADFIVGSIRPTKLLVVI